MTLAELGPGERGRVIGWGSDGPPTRLLEMGVLEGTEVEVVRRAPLGDPIDLRVRGYHLSIRETDAAEVLVEPL